jgi:hypothetical protein
MSWHEHKFLIGCSTSVTGFVQDDKNDEFVLPIESKGLVSMHAYSVIDLVEVFDVAVGKQLKLTDMFGNNSGTKNDRIERLRLVQVRNPWGRREWRGHWGAKSEKWTKTLASHISNPGEGKFWIQFEDFVQAFDEIDVAKTHADWFSIVVESSRGPFTVSEILGRTGIGEGMLQVSSPFVPSWCYITLVQPSIRGGGRSGYLNLGFVLLAGGRSVHASHIGQADRVMTVETMLEAGVEYSIVIFALGGVPNDDVYRNVIRIYSAEQLVLKDCAVEAETSIMTSPMFEGILAQNLPQVTRTRVCEGVYVDLIGTNSVAAWVLVVAGACERSLRIGIKLTQPNKLVLSGQWMHSINQSRGGYKTVLGIAAETRTRGYYASGILAGIDFDVEIESAS